MASPKRSLAGIICNTFNLELDSEEFYFLLGQTLSYITKGISAFEYQRIVKPYCKGLDTSAKRFRLTLYQRKYLCLDIKLFLLRMARVKSVNLDLVKALQAEFELYIVDAKRIYEVWRTQSVFRARLKKQVREIHKDDLHLLTFSGLAKFFQDELYAPIMRRIKSIAYKRLRFLMSSTNQTREDFHNELLEKVVQAFYGQVPVMKSTAHLINYLAQSADNHAVNIIKSETSLKRGRLVNVGLDRNGLPRFELLCVSQNQTRTKTEDGADIDYTDVDTGNDMRSFELEFSVSEILNRYAGRAKKHKMMLLLMGTEDKEFTEWLRKRKLASRSEDNVDVQTNVSVADFNRLVSEFLHVSETKTNVFLLKLRKHLALPEEHVGKLAAA